MSLGRVDEPANPEQPEGEQPDHHAKRAAIIEPVRAGKTEKPEQVADDHAVGGRSSHGQFITEIVTAAMDKPWSKRCELRSNQMIIDLDVISAPSGF